MAQYPISSHLVRTINLTNTHGPFTGDEDFAEEQSNPMRKRVKVVATVDGVSNLIINGTTTTFTAASSTATQIRDGLEASVDGLTATHFCLATDVSTDSMDISIDYPTRAPFGTPITLSTSGAQAANLQVNPNWGLTIYKVERAPLIWRCIANDENDLPIPADGLTVSACLFKIGVNSDGKPVISRTASTVESMGSQQSTQLAIIDEDVVPGELVAFGILAVTNPGSVEQIKIYADSVVQP